MRLEPDRSKMSQLVASEMQYFGSKYALSLLIGSSALVTLISTLFSLYFYFTTESDSNLTYTVLSLAALAALGIVYVFYHSEAVRGALHYRAVMGFSALFTLICAVSGFAFSRTAWMWKMTDIAPFAYHRYLDTVFSYCFLPALILLAAYAALLWLPTDFRLPYTGWLFRVYLLVPVSIVLIVGLITKFTTEENYIRVATVWTLVYLSLMLLIAAKFAAKALLHKVLESTPSRYETFIKVRQQSSLPKITAAEIAVLQSQVDADNPGAQEAEQVAEEIADATEPEPQTAQEPAPLEVEAGNDAGPEKQTATAETENDAGHEDEKAAGEPTNVGDTAERTAEQPTGEGEQAENAAGRDSGTAAIKNAEAAHRPSKARLVEAESRFSHWIGRLKVFLSELKLPEDRADEGLGDSARKSVYKAPQQAGESSAARGGHTAELRESPAEPVETGHGVGDAGEEIRKTEIADDKDGKTVEDNDKTENLNDNDGKAVEERPKTKPVAETDDLNTGAETAGKPEKPEKSRTTVMRGMADTATFAAVSALGALRALLARLRGDQDALAKNEPNEHHIWKKSETEAKTAENAAKPGRKDSDQPADTAEQREKDSFDLAVGEVIGTGVSEGKTAVPASVCGQMAAWKDEDDAARPADAETPVVLYAEDSCCDAVDEPARNLKKNRKDWFAEITSELERMAGAAKPKQPPKNDEPDIVEELEEKSEPERDTTQNETQEELIEVLEDVELTAPETTGEQDGKAEEAREPDEADASETVQTRESIQDIEKAENASETAETGTMPEEEPEEVVEAEAMPEVVLEETVEAEAMPEAELEEMVETETIPEAQPAAATETETMPEEKIEETLETGKTPEEKPAEAVEGKTIPEAMPEAQPAAEAVTANGEQAPNRDGDAADDADHTGTSIVKVHRRKVQRRHYGSPHRR